MADTQRNTGLAVEIHFPPQEIDHIVDEVLKIARSAAEALARDWHEHGSPRVMAGLCAWRTDKAVR